MLLADADTDTDMTLAADVNISGKWEDDHDLIPLEAVNWAQ